MNDNTLERLRRENPFPQTLPAPPIEPLLGRLGDRGSGSQPRRRLAFGRVLGAAGVALAVAVAVLAVILVGRGHRPAPLAVHQSPPVTSPPSQGTPASYLNMAYQETVRQDPACSYAPQQLGTPRLSDAAPSRSLLSAFGVLRRPATTADRLSQSDSTLRFRVVYERYIRRARVIDGTSYYLIPGQSALPPPLRCVSEQRAALERLVTPLPSVRRAAIMQAGTRMLAQERRARLDLPSRPYDSLALVGIGRDAGGTCCATASGAPSISISGTIADGVVPDGVASVSLYYATTRSQNVSTIIAKATRVVTATVTSNLYVVNLGSHGRPEPSAVVYRSASGAVIRGFDTNQ